MVWDVTAYYINCMCWTRDEARLIKIYRVMLHIFSNLYVLDNHYSFCYIEDNNSIETPHSKPKEWELILNSDLAKQADVHGTKLPRLIFTADLTDKDKVTNFRNLFHSLDTMKYCSWAVTLLLMICTVLFLRCFFSPGNVALCLILYILYHMFILDSDDENWVRALAFILYLVLCVGYDYLYDINV